MANENTKAMDARHNETPGDGKALRLSVLMTLCGKDSPEHFEQCLQSLAAQSRPAEEIVLVRQRVGAPLQAVVERWRERLPLRVVEVESNLSLGAAMRLGLPLCQNPWVARMDADDVCEPERFRLQCERLQAHPELDVLGGAIAEFESSPELCHALRQPPSGHEAIARFARLRNPINHMTVVFRRDKALACGSYEERPYVEDYALWVRMLAAGARFDNLQETLVRARVGNGMMRRRGGLRAMRAELGLQFMFWRIGFVSAPQALRALLVRSAGALIPVWLRRLAYARWMRKKTADNIGRI